MTDIENARSEQPAAVSGRPGEDTPEQSWNSSARPRWQFRIQSLLWLTVVIALALACLVQYRDLRRAERALARNSWASRETSIPVGKFRLMVNQIADDRDLKVWVIRLEANGEHYITVGGQSSTTSAMA